MYNSNGLAALLPHAPSMAGPTADSQSGWNTGASHSLRAPILCNPWTPPQGQPSTLTPHPLPSTPLNIPLWFISSDSSFHLIELPCAFQLFSKTPIGNKLLHFSSSPSPHNHHVTSHWYLQPIPSPPSGKSLCSATCSQSQKHHLPLPLF